MTIEFRCDCGELFQVEDEFAGRKGRCPTCKRIMVVPEKEPEPLELRDEIQEEEEFISTVGTVDLPESHAEPPSGGRVEEEVEVLRGSEGPEPDLGRMESPAPKPMNKAWARIPRPLLLGVPAALAGILLLILLIRPSAQRSEHPALERAPSASLVEKLPASPQPQEQKAITQTPPPPTADSPKAEASQGLPSVQQAQPEKGQQPKAATTPTGREEERRAAATPSSQAGSPAPKPSAPPTKDVKPKEPVSKPQASAPPRAPSPSSENYTVNVGAFKSQGMADAYSEVLRKRGLDPFVWSTDLAKGQGKMYRVSIGRFPTKRQADLYAKELKDKHGLNTYVVKKPGS